MISKLCVLKESVIRFVYIIIKESLPEFLCLLLSFCFYLFYDSFLYLYAGFPLILSYNALNIKYSSVSLGGMRVLVIYTILLVLFYLLGAPKVLWGLCLFLGIAILVFSSRQSFASRIYSLAKHLFWRFYYAAGFLLLVIIAYVIASLFVSNQESLKRFFLYSCMFAFVFIWPLIFFTIDRRMRDREVEPPIWLRWLHLIFAETFVIILIIYWEYMIFRMFITSLFPRPYVVYMVIATIFFIESVAQLHKYSPRNWNHYFFSCRDIFYVSLFLVGISSLYIEYQIIGLGLRIYAVSGLMLYLSVVVVVRTFNINRIRTVLRRLTLYYFFALALFAVIAKLFL